MIQPTGDRPVANGQRPIAADLDAGLAFDLIASIMLYASIFPLDESWKAYIRRALKLFLR
ncbi:MAG: hypothetical protein OHK0037_20650 [Elainellaceae cyanobacterium]